MGNPAEPPFPTRSHDPAPTPDGPSQASDLAGAGTVPAAPPRPAGPPPDVPGYERLAEIARGGMGVVYRARDAALDRDVAVKLLQDRFPPGSAVARRFLDEARITAQLQHPGIPSVYAVGALPDGRPFLAMKLIKGQTLEELLQARPDLSAGRGELLAAFGQACQAVAYAHDRGVIHRDLKPANVMVGAFGEVQVMDWGLAKVLASRGVHPSGPPEDADNALTAIRSLRDAGSATVAGSVLGTPAFMPPEQAGGEVEKIDERSDVFGLGAILCVLLTGKPPYTGPTSEAVQLMAIRGELRQAFDRLDGCGAEPELVALCRRCLAPQREDRPRNAGEVAGAVSAFRAEAEDRARRAELDRARAEVRAVEERRRRRVQLGLGVALAVAFGLVGLVLGWQEWQAAGRAREQAAAREAARQNLGEALDRAAAAFREDRLPAVDASLDRAAELLDPAGADGLRQRYADLRADRALVAELDRVWTRSNALIDDRAPGAGVFGPTSATMDDRSPQPVRRGGGFRFDEAAARQGYPAAFAARGLAVGSADPGELAGRIDRSPARDRLLAALDDWLPVADPADRPRLCDLLARADPDPARGDIRRAHAEPDGLQALFAQAPPDGALPVAARAARSEAVPDDRALAVLRTAAVRSPGDFGTQYAAAVRTLRSDRPAAVGYFRAAQALRPDDLAAVAGLGLALHVAGKPAEAAPYFLRAIEIDPGYVTAYINLADAIRLGADPAPAVAHFEKAVARGPNDPMAHFGLGMALREHDRPRAAAAFRRSIALHEPFAPAHNYLGYVLDRDEELDERVRCWRRTIQLDPTFAFGYYNLAGALRDKGDPRGAEAAYREALRLFPAHTFSLRNLAHLRADQRRWDEAAPLLRRVIEIEPGIPDVYPQLGRVLLAAGDPAGAAAVYRECIKRFPTWHAGYDGLLQAQVRRANMEALRAYHDAVIRGGPARWAEMRPGVAAAAGGSALALVDRPWPADTRYRLRYNAACAAALAGSGNGADAPPPPDRPALRRFALDTLRAELNQLRAARTPADRQRAKRLARDWLDDADFTSVRHPMAVHYLPAEERDAWRALWAGVRAVRDAP